MSPNAGAPKTAVRVLLRWLARLLALLFAATVAGALVVVVLLPRATQGSAMTVLTGSMTPGIPVGSIVMVRPVDPSTLQVGDVATYQAEPGKSAYITHRIAKIDTTAAQTEFTFKGDANRGPDLDPVVAKQIRGEVWFHVPYLGSVRDALHGKGGVTLWATLLLAGYALSQVGAGLRERREKQQAQPVEIPVNRDLIVATLDVDRVAARLGLSPAETANAWGAALVHVDAKTCTFLLAPDRQDIETTLDQLHQVEPRELHVIDEAGSLTGLGGRSLQRGLPQDDRVDA
jgi:signal peptidase